jgi:hypothetical protein
MATQLPSLAQDLPRLLGLVPAAILGCFLVVSSQPTVAEIIVGGSGGSAPGGGVAAQGARDARQRATVERWKGDGDMNSPNVVIINGVSNGVGGNDWSATGSPAANSAAYNKRRANENRVFLGDDAPTPAVVVVPSGQNAAPYYGTPAEESASRNAARANAYRQRND